MQSDCQIQEEHNVPMFDEISLRDQLHQVKQPEAEASIFDLEQESMADSVIARDGNDDQKSENVQETLEDTIFKSNTEQQDQPRVKTRNSKKQHCEQKKNSAQSVRKQKKISKRQSQSKKDYKKNICGYITRRAVKQALSLDYQSNILELCKPLDVNPQNFYRIYRAHNTQNITGPTHFYKLVNPNLHQTNLEENIKEISTRIVFVLFFQWFVRNRYIRYLILDGKMSQKDKYINYKNRELMWLVASEQKDVLERARENMINESGKAQDFSTRVSMIYSQIVEGSRVQIGDQKQKQQKQYFSQMQRTASKERQHTQIDEESWDETVQKIDSYIQLDNS